ncbi:hypothetical protein PAPYR_11371 [Paratrimastix pyriformis]|uniref:Uncharacterized protein n=1 Tax=Paratrimastix pyriformis TaxID=342808 RepID=A0ABQ8U3X2_9EUKA|nr:hypothetical protein PAPYR_11371 [Paratrimastix pyriformis]
MVPAPSVRAAAWLPSPICVGDVRSANLRVAARAGQSPVARGALAGRACDRSGAGFGERPAEGLGRHLPRVEDPDVFDTVAALAMELRRLPVDDLPIDLARTLRSLLLASGLRAEPSPMRPAVGPSVGGSAPVTGGPAPVALRRYRL